MRVVGLVVLLSFAVAGNAQQQQGELTVPLDETGIARWGFLNPKTPVALGADESLVFRNDTANRTFVVTIPFEFRTEDFATVYTTAALTTPMTMPAFVSRVLRQPTPDCLRNDAGSMLCKLEYLQLLREDIAALKGSAVKPAALTVAAHGLLTPDHLEALYWTAACATSDEQRSRLGAGEDDPPELRDQLKKEADALVQRLLADPQIVPPFCHVDDAAGLRERTLERLQLKGMPDTAATFRDRTRLTVLARFANSRIAIAKAALLAAIERQIASIYGTAQILKAIDDRRKDVEGDELLTAAQRDCEIGLLRAAATLFATYGPGAKVPFTSSLLHDPEAACDPRGYVSTSKMAAYNQEERTARTRFQNTGFEIVDCTGDAKTTCVARATIPPQQRAVIGRSLLERSGKRVQFTVTFFAEAEPPSNATGYAFLSSETRAVLNQNKRPKETLPGQTPEKLTFNFAGDAGLDYALPKNAVASHVRRAVGGGSLGFQYIGPYDLSATLQFKKGEFGGGTATNQVQATQYQAKVFGPIGTVLEYGKFLFARPSSSIAVSEFGEGLRFSFRRVNIGYLIRRESDNPTQTADLADDDSYVLIGQFNAPVPFLRSFLLTATWGNDEGDAAPADNPDCVQFKTDPKTGVKTPLTTPCNVPHLYSTAGFDAKFPITTNVSGSLAAYHSIRNLRHDRRLEPPLLPPEPNFAPTSDGKGDVALLTVSWSKLIEQSLLSPLDQAKPSFSLTGFLGYGSSDDPASTDRDESYLGETAGFANDKLFLSTLTGTKKALGAGLANKWYAGLQYTNARWSPLKYIAGFFDALDEVQSMTTVITAHKYQFSRALVCPKFPVDDDCKAEQLVGARDGGYEIDVDFLIESPKNVRWSLGAGWYRSSRAVEAVGIKDNPWVVLANVSLKFNAR